MSASSLSTVGWILGWTCMDAGGAANPARVQGQLGVCHSHRHGPPDHGPAMVLLLRAPWVPKPIISVENRGEEGIKHLCFAYVIVCEETFPIK